MQPDQHIVEHAQAAKHAGFLEGAHHAKLRNFVGFSAVEPDTAVAHRAGRWRNVARDGVEGRGLAGAVRPDQRQHLSLPHLERHLVHGGQAAEADRQPCDGKLDCRLRRHAEASDLAAAAGGWACGSPRPCHQLRRAGTMPSGRK